MMRTSSACAALWLVALSGHLAGCIGIEPPARDDVVESAVTTSTTTIPYNICENFDVCRMRDAPVTVLAGLPVIGHPDDEVCVLSGVGGVKTNVGPNFAFAELGREWFDETGDSFTLKGNALAICVPTSRFFSWSGNAEVLYSDFWTVGYWPAGGVSFPLTADTWWGDAATFLAGVHGLGMAGDGKDKATISQSSDPFTPSKVKLSYGSGVTGVPSARAASLFVGHPQSGSLPRLAQCPGDCGRDSTEFKISAGHNQEVTRQLTWTSAALCYLTEVSGYIRGGGEWVSIAPRKDDGGTEYWMLTAHAQSGTAAAKARCIFYDQL